MQVLSELMATSTREWLVTIKSWKMALLAAAGPLLTFLLFAVALASTIGTVQYRDSFVPYLLFVFPGILAMNGISSGLHAGVPLYIDRMTGELEAQFALPVSRNSLFIGKAVVLSSRAVLQSLVVICASLLLIDGVTHNPARLVGALLAVFVIGLSFSFSFMALACVAKQESFNFITNIAYPPFLFLSPLYYPLERLPGILRVLATGNPLTYGVNLVRSLLLDKRILPIDVLVVSGFLLLSYILIWLGFKRTIE